MTRYTPRVEHAEAIAAAFAQQRGRLWGVCYRMAGCAADADDWLQDTFERALRSPPADVERDLSGWLLRVAINLCRDHLRRRQHDAYTGPWLPGPVETSALFATLQDARTPEARYTQRESVSLAFLHALEALTPGQRAVLLLRDVLGCSVQATAEALDKTPGNVKTTHHRARAAMRAYDEAKAVGVSAAVQQRVTEAVLAHLATGSEAALRSLIADDALMITDSDGDYTAARVPIRGRGRILRFWDKTRRLPQGVWLGSVNGTPAALLHLRPHARPNLPERICFWVTLDASGRVTRLNSVVSDRKVSGLPWDRVGRPPAGQVLRVLRAAATTPPIWRWAPGLLRR